MAVAEGYLKRNPAQLLFTPRECPRPATRTMNMEDVRLLFQFLHPASASLLDCQSCPVCARAKFSA
jgi:hypothetical protein